MKYYLRECKLKGRKLLLNSLESSSLRSTGPVFQQRILHSICFCTQRFFLFVLFISHQNFPKKTTNTTNDISDIGGTEEEIQVLPTRRRKYMSKTMEPDRRLQSGHNSFPKARQLSKFRSQKIFNKDEFHISPPHINVKFHVFF